MHRQSALSGLDSLQAAALRRGSRSQPQVTLSGTYYVLDENSDEWLQDDERSWGRFGGALGFTDPKLALDIGRREAKGVRRIAVLALMDPHQTL